MVSVYNYFSANWWNWKRINNCWQTDCTICCICFQISFSISNSQLLLIISPLFLKHFWLVCKCFLNWILLLGNILVCFRISCCLFDWWWLLIMILLFIFFSWRFYFFFNFVLMRRNSLWLIDWFFFDLLNGNSF